MLVHSECRTSGDDQVDSILFKPRSVESVVSGNSVTSDRRTPVIDPPFRFQTNTSSSKENLDVSDIVVQVDPPAPSPSVEVPTCTRTDSNVSSQPSRGQSVDVSVLTLHNYYTIYISACRV